MQYATRAEAVRTRPWLVTESMPKSGPTARSMRAGSSSTVRVQYDFLSKNSLTPKQCQVHNLLAEFRQIIVEMRVQRVQCRHMAFLLYGYLPQFTLRRKVSKPSRIAFSIFDKLSPRSSRAILESLP